MIADSQTLQIISRWLGNLAKLTRHRQGKLDEHQLRAFKDEMALYTDMLGKSLPSAAFTNDSLHAVIEGNPFFPAFDHIRETVQAWWNKNRPQHSTAIGGPEDDDPKGAHLTGMDRHWFKYWLTRQGEGFGPVQPGACDDVDANRAQVASLIRSKSSKAWAAINGEEEVGVRVPTDAELARVHAMLHLDPHGPAATAETRPGPLPDPLPDVTLTGEALRKSREARGLKVPPPKPKADDDTGDGWEKPEPEHDPEDET